MEFCNEKGNIDEFPTHMFFHHLAHLMGIITIKQLRKFNLKPGQVGILFILAKHGTMSQKDLALRMGITPPSMTVAIRKLEALKLIEKSTDEKDSRIVRIKLTKVGEHKIKEVFSSVKSVDDVIYKGFAPEERVLARRFMVQMVDNLREYRDANKKEMKEVLDEFKKSGHKHF